MKEKGIDKRTAPGHEGANEERSKEVGQRDGETDELTNEISISCFYFLHIEKSLDELSHQFQGANWNFLSTGHLLDHRAAFSHTLGYVMLCCFGLL